MSKFRDLQILTAEADGLTAQPTMTKQDERRFNLILAKISLVKQGVTLAELDQEEFNDRSVKNGFSPTNFSKRDREKRAEDFQNFVRESRDGGVGSNTPGHFAGLGYFVPTGFVKGVTKAAQKAGDAILNPDYVSFIKSTTGAPLALPVYNDTSENAATIGEGAISGTALDPTVPDVQYPGQIALGAINYRQTYITSLEAFNDVEASGNLLNLWEQWTAARIARAVGHDMMVGSDSAKILGLVNQLQNAGATVIVANGSSEITGIADSAATTIGARDLASLVFNLDTAYLSSPKTAFWMSPLTLIKLAQLVNKEGLPVVTWQGSVASIWGYPVRLCPSMSTPQASQVSVLFGDGSYIYTRRVLDPLANVRVLKERFVDIGAVGLQCTSRWDMKLAYQGQGSSPFTLLQQSS